MAITIDDFSKIWASTSPLTPYSFSDDNYKNGWNFVGGTPPSRQMWDFLQKNNDEKMQYLANNYLPLSGGTMTGNLTFDKSDARVNNSRTDGITAIYGGVSGSTGALGVFHGKDHANSGQFHIYASDGSNSTVLVGSPAGTLKWNNKEVERVNAKGSNYIRYESGLQICFDDDSVSASNAGAPFANSGNKNVIFPVAFNSVPKVFANIYDSAGYWNVECQAVTTTSVVISIGGNNTNAKSVSYVAIGYWK